MTLSSVVYYRISSKVPWEKLPEYCWGQDSAICPSRIIPSSVKESDHFNHRILLESIFQKLCNGKKVKRSNLDTTKYTLDVLMDYCTKKEDGVSHIPDLGPLAIHVAAMVDYHTWDPKARCGTRVRILRNTILRVLETLRKIHPEAFQVSLSHGRLPLHWTLETGKVWDGWNRHCDNSIPVKAIPFLVDAYPNSVSVVDPITGLAPFMMAAAASSSYDEQSVSSIDTTYRLLRMDPTKLIAYKTKFLKEDGNKLRGKRSGKCSAAPVKKRRRRRFFY